MQNWAEINGHIIIYIWHQNFN